MFCKKMFSAFTLYAFLLLVGPYLHAAEIELRGEISNGTTGKAGSAEAVVLYRLDQGMEEIASVRNVRGAFRLKAEVPQNPVPFLLQAVYKGVTHNVQLNLGEDGLRTVINIPVYDIMPEPESVSFRMPHLFIRRENNSLSHRLLFEVNNRAVPPKSWYSPEGTFRFYVPEDIAGDISASVSTGNVPVTVIPVETDEKNVYTIDHAFKPGTSNISISYSTEYANEEYHLSMPVYYPLEELNLFVAPPDIQVTASGFTRQAIDESQGFAYYLAAGIQPDKAVEVNLSGGSAVAPQAGQNRERTIGEMEPPINEYTVPLAVTFMLILLFGSLYLVQWEQGKRKDARENEGLRKSLSSRRDSMITAIAGLDQKFAENAVAENEYRDERARLKERLIAVLEQLDSSQKSRL